MLDLFVNQSPARVEAALTAGREGNLVALGEAVRSLKSTAANVGATKVQSLAQQLEQLAGDGNSASIPPLLDELKKAFARAKARLEDEWAGMSL
jgi:HPt (histidine-containing phosphotransfer) domain-containing protein